jgi:spermidine synthase
MTDRRASRCLLVCLLLSGMSGLVYEVAWVRSLELIFGATTFAIATVLASFMGGLAAGSAAAGALEPRLRRWHPLRLYAACEAGIAVAALLVPLAFRLLVPLSRAIWEAFHASFAAFSVLRFVLCAAVLLIPTALMGATLPILSRFVATVDRGSEAARRVGILFAVNTAGAVAGCALAGLVLMPGLGLLGTQCAAVALNLLAAAGALAIARRRPFDAMAIADRPAAPEETGPASDAFAVPGRAGLFIAAYAISGGVAMLYEVAWSRSLVLVLGSSTYSYTTMLTTFLVGLTLGAWLGTRVLKSKADPLLAIALCQLLTAAMTAIGLFTAGELPFLYVRLGEALDPSARGLLGVHLALAALVMFPPTIGLGAMFPLTLAGIGMTSGRAQRLVSRAYAWNTVGAIAGSLLGGFWLLPLLGSRDALILGTAINAAMAFLGIALTRSSELRALPRAALLVLIAALGLHLALAAPPWSSDVMSSGVFRYADRYRGLDRAEFRKRVRESHGDILFFEEGLTCTISVFRTTRSLTMLNNGKPDASVPPGLAAAGAPVPAAGRHPEPLGDLPTQVLVGQIPLLLAERIDDVMVVGLGSGVTLGSVLTHDVKKVDTLELEGAVVRASRFFDAHSGTPLDDPRVALVVNDARNDLLLREHRYDVIISEPSNPWIPGAASLFTRDFFRMARARLQPHGLLCQWVQLYELWPEDFQAILRSFAEVFPAVQIWRVGSDAILIGGPSDIRLPMDRIFARASDRVRGDLARIGIRGPEELLAHFWIGGDELRAAIPSGPINTDDNMRIEFAAPLRMMARDHERLERQKRELGGMFRGRTTAALPLLRFPEEDAGKQGRFLALLARAAEARGFPDEAQVYAAAAWERFKDPDTAATRAVILATAGSGEEAAGARADAERRWPDDPGVQRMLLDAAVVNQEPEAIRHHALALLRRAPDDAPARYELARVLSAAGENAAALRAILPLRPLFSPPSVAGPAVPDGAAKLLGLLLAGAGRSAEAAPVLRAHLAASPDDAAALTALAGALRAEGKEAEAVAIERRLAPDAASQAATRLAAGQQAFEAGRDDTARAALEEALQFAPDNEAAALLLARTLHRLGDTPTAAVLLQSWLAGHPDRPLAVGLLSQVLQDLGQQSAAAAAASRYRALTGEDWAGTDAVATRLPQ